MAGPGTVAAACNAGGNTPQPPRESSGSGAMSDYIAMYQALSAATRTHWQELEPDNGGEPEDRGAPLQLLQLKRENAVTTASALFSLYLDSESRDVASSSCIQDFGTIEMY